MSEYDPSIQISATVVYPLLLYAFNADAQILTVLIAAGLAFGWGMWGLRELRVERLIPMVAIVGLLVPCACCMVAIGGDDELDIFYLGEQLAQFQSVSVNGKNYPFVLRYSYNGRYGGILFECDRLGLLCKPVHIQSWGTESLVNNAFIPQTRQPASLIVEDNSIILRIGEEVLFRYTLV